MNIIIELICTLILLLLIIIVFWGHIINNCFQVYNLKINKSLAKINKGLTQRYDILFKTLDFLNKNITIDEEELQSFLNVNLKKIEPFELNDIISESQEIIQKYLNQNEKLVNDPIFIELNNQNKNAIITTNATINYYNDIVKLYNNYRKKFPYKIIAKSHKYHNQKEFTIHNKASLKILNNDIDS